MGLQITDAVFTIHIEINLTTVNCSHMRAAQIEILILWIWMSLWYPSPVSFFFLHIFDKTKPSWFMLWIYYKIKLYINVWENYMKSHATSATDYTMILKIILIFRNMLMQSSVSLRFKTLLLFGQLFNVCFSYGCLYILGPKRTMLCVQ